MPGIADSDAAQRARIRLLEKSILNRVVLALYLYSRTRVKKVSQGRDLRNYNNNLEIGNCISCCLARLPS